MRAAASVSLVPLAAAAWCLPALAPVMPPVADALGVRRRAAPAGPVVHLTFDDGPHPQGTPAVLSALDAAGVRATFFLVAEQVERFPSLAVEVAAAGHAVGVHGYRHRCLLRLAPRALADDMRRAIEVIGALAAPPVALYRPPYGIFSPAGLALAARLRLAPWLWSRWGRDWRADATAASVTELAARGLQAGDVVLLHDADHYSDPGCWRATAAAIPAILARVGEAGLRAAAL
jgi:peptidoglycan-N-acetylglucosamine deacetylase